MSPSTLLFFLRVAFAIQCLLRFHMNIKIAFFLVLLVKVTQLCLTLCDPTDYTVHGILQVKIVEWVAFPFSRRSSQPRDQTQVSCIRGGFFTSWATREAQLFFFFYLWEKCQWNFDGDYSKVMDYFVSMDNTLKLLILPIHENKILSTYLCFQFTHQYLINWSWLKYIGFFIPLIKCIPRYLIFLYY